MNSTRDENNKDNKLINIKSKLYTISKKCECIVNENKCIWSTRFFAVVEAVEYKLRSKGTFIVFICHTIIRILSITFIKIINRLVYLICGCCIYSSSYRY